MKNVASLIVVLLSACSPIDSSGAADCGGAWSPITGICTYTTHGDLHDAAHFVDGVALTLGGDYRGVSVYLVKDPAFLAEKTGGHCVGGLTHYEAGITWATPGSLAHELTHWDILRSGRFVPAPDGATWDEHSDHVHTAAGGWFDQDEMRMRWANRERPTTPFSGWGSSCRSN